MRRNSPAPLAFSLVALSCLALASEVHAKPSLIAEIKKQAQKMGAAVIAGDFATMVDFMYPRLVAAMGGRDAVIASVKRQMTEGADSGFGIIDVHVLSATPPIKAGTELHSVVTCVQRMKGPHGAVAAARTVLVAASNDAGRTWKFANVPRENPEVIKTLFPVWNASLQIPAPTKAVPVRGM